jgi:hypothetical protein
MSREAETQRNRELMPETARIVAEFRAAFGGGLRCPYLEEGAEVRGKPAPPARAMNADQWLHYVKTGEMPC